MSPSTRLISSALAFSACCLGLASAASGPVTLFSLLVEMTDHAAVARWPDPEFTCVEASSHDRRTVAPDQPGWFANDDHTQYIRTENTEGRTEQVMMDEEGPGALVRFWLTTVQNKSGVLRVYLDGAAKPALEFPAYDLMAGDLKLSAPMVLAHPGYTPDGNGGNTLMLPVPYARHCKVTWEEKGKGPRYYQIEFRRYAAGTAVTTFNRKDLETARPLIAKAGKALLAPEALPVAADKWMMLPDVTLAPGEQGDWPLASGAKAVRSIELELKPGDPAELAAALRTTVVRMEFDGEETVWCPAGDFFGSGVGLNKLENWYRTIRADGKMSCRWVMPYEKSARISLLNLGAAPVRLQLTVRTLPWRWDDHSMHFHSAWHQEAGLRTPPHRDWNFVTLDGRGVYVGDTLSIYNPVATWYGEGDEKIRVDGEVLPSHLGTGTEDYYNYSFAPRGIMQTPFANQTRVDQEMTQGHNVMTRSRNLDGIPFRKSFDFEMELISWRPTRPTYAVATYWYAFPGAGSNRVPEPEQARAAIPTLADAQRPPAPFPGVLDAELLKVSSQTPGMEVRPQEMGAFDGSWSRNTQLLAKAVKPGSFVVLEIPAPDARPRAILLAATRAPDYGKLEFSVNGKDTGKAFDGYAASVEAGAETPLGTFDPVDGKFSLKIEATGSNAAAIGAKHYFGIDYVRLVEK